MVLQQRAALVRERVEGIVDRLAEPRFEALGGASHGARRRGSSGADVAGGARVLVEDRPQSDRKSTRLNSSHGYISYAVFCLKKKTEEYKPDPFSLNALN